MFALASVAVFFLLIGNSREGWMYNYYKSIFGWTDKDIDLMEEAIYNHGGMATFYLSWNPKLTKKINSAYTIWTHLSPESKKFVQNFNDLYFDERTHPQESNFPKLKPYVDSLSKDAREEMCEVYKGFAALLHEFGAFYKKFAEYNKVCGNKCHILMKKLAMAGRNKRQESHLEGTEVLRKPLFV